MDNIQTGLMVSLVGITITFLALGIFIGVIVVLQKLFPPKHEENESIEEESPAQIAATSSEEGEDESFVAALAAAAYMRSRQSSQLGAALLAGPGPFKTTRQ